MGKLMPYFIAANNTFANDMKVVTRGHERVIRARLEDAIFFYKSDLKIKPETRIEKLKGVLFQEKLGTMYEKVQRVEQVAEFLANILVKTDDEELKQDVLKAVWLCKSDLVSHIVIEFPKLQGVMGRIYASIAKEKNEVAAAVEEHYMPTHSGSRLPKTKTGAILSIADKIDSICGAFAVGFIPTGAADPYALRRQGIGILQIMLDKEFSLSLGDMIKMSLSLFDNLAGMESDKTFDNVYTFLKNRMEHMIIENGFSKDIVVAVIRVFSDNISEVHHRINSLERLKAKAGFEP
eukprot:CAMPEP_0201284608 /NCGR_PEP_ID=MMETSP1317-20130820/79444_1 /ASSEMBLY_ACC=CAM_ASM_000770 /TAXON_ID=187299 /ORGANISM="Undescribed Undescribed, Strain Undescribed" /LENGTH=292 /DNA_ID=CAMNT_0047605459 /DNA_START=2900 /DNA_END=3774 /DNA_ORIENTATION=+